MRADRRRRSFPWGLLAAALVATASSGCVVYDVTDDEGNARIQFGLSSQSCQNGKCTYSAYNDRLQDSVTCGRTTTLEWAVASRDAGSFRLWVEDDTGEVHHNATVTFGSGLVDLQGSQGKWRLHADLSGFNGNFEATLSC